MLVRGLTSWLALKLRLLAVLPGWGLPVALRAGLALLMLFTPYALLSLGVAGPARADEPLVELTAEPALKGWSRPGRATELDLRISSDAPAQLALQLVAGNTTVLTRFDAQPGRPARVQVPVGAFEKVQVRVAVVAAAAATVGAALPTAAAPSVALPLQREVTLALSESPLLGVALAGPESAVQLDGFHAVPLGAGDLPRNASAYTSLDALVIDAPTLAALDARQLAALLAHASACGRIAVVSSDPAVRRVLQAAGGCGGQALISADTPQLAQQGLANSFSGGQPASLAPAMTLAGLGELARPALLGWNRVALGLAVYFAAALLLLLAGVALAALLWVPVMAAAASVAALVLLQAWQPASQLLVWSEGDSGAPLARYQAWQRFSGSARERTRQTIPAQLAPSAQACDRKQALILEFDAASGLFTVAEYESRLFHQVLLCYSGSFPMARAPQSALAAGATAGAQTDSTSQAPPTTPSTNPKNTARQVHNAGALAWPPGALLADGRAQGLPALAPGERAVLNALPAPGERAVPGDGPAPGQRTVLGTVPAPAWHPGAVQAALPRVGPDAVAALWALDLGGVAGAPVQSQGWLLVTLPPP